MGVDPEQAVPVGNVAQEYEIVAADHCRCGGDFRVLRQALLFHEGRPYDLLETVCVQCGQAREFLFDISDFFGKE